MSAANDIVMKNLRSLLEKATQCDTPEGASLANGAKVVLSFLGYEGLDYEQRVAKTSKEHTLHKSKVKLYVRSYLEDKLIGLYDALGLPLSQRKPCLQFYKEFLTDKEKAILDEKKSNQGSSPATDSTCGLSPEGEMPPVAAPIPIPPDAGKGTGPAGCRSGDSPDNCCTYDIRVLRKEVEIAGQNSLLSKIVSLITANPTCQGEKWTNRTVADALGTSTWKVSQALSASSLSFERNTCWKFLTPNDSGHEKSGLIGIYVGKKDWLLLFEKREDGVCSDGQGLFSTQNSMLAKELSEYQTHVGSLPIETVLASAARHAQDEGKKKDFSLHRYWNDIFPSLAKQGEAAYTMVYYGKAGKLTLGRNGLDTELIRCKSESEWLSEAMKRMPPEQGPRFSERLGEYADRSYDAKEPFYWFRKPGKEEPESSQNDLGGPPAPPEPDRETVPDTSSPPEPKKGIVMQCQLPNGQTMSMTIELSESLTSMKVDPTSRDCIIQLSSGLESELRKGLDNLGSVLMTQMLSSTISTGTESIEGLIPRCVEIETLIGRAAVPLYGEAAASLATNERLKTSTFTAVESYLGSLVGFRQGGVLMNMIARRTEESKIDWSVLRKDDLRRGKLYMQALDNAYKPVLEELGIVMNEDGEIIDHSSADKLTMGLMHQKRIINVSPFALPDMQDYDMRGIADCNYQCNGAMTGEVGVPVPDPYLRSYMISPTALPDKSDPMHQYIADYNYRRKQFPIQGDFFLETSPAKTAYICTDDILTSKQKKKKKRKKVLATGSQEESANAAEETKEESASADEETKEESASADEGTTDKWIYHSVAHIYVPGMGVYIFDTTSQKKLYSIIYSFLIKNGLQDRFLLFFSDGEETLKTYMDEVFSEWPHRMIGDFWHMGKHISDFCSLIFYSGKVPDPWKKPRYFKNGKVIKSSITYITKSRLQARELKVLLWTGNIDEAITRLKGMANDKELVRNQKRLWELVGYLERKKDRMMPFVIRQKLHLPNSSNRVENANNLLVAIRQKKKGMSWCDEGSFAISGLTSVFQNMDAERFFLHGTISFAPRLEASKRKLDDVLKWVYTGFQINDFEPSSQTHPSDDGNADAV